MRGRPPENRKSITVWVEEHTKEKINRTVDKKNKKFATKGRVIDVAMSKFKPSVN